MNNITYTKGNYDTWANATVTLTKPNYTNPTSHEDTGTCPDTNAKTTVKDTNTAAVIYTTKKEDHKIAIPIPKDKPKEVGITFTEYCENGGKKYGIPHTDTKLTIKTDGTLIIKGTLKYTDKVKDNKCININLKAVDTQKVGPPLTHDAIKKASTVVKPTDAAVAFGHVFTEKFDMSKVHLHIVSPTLMVIVGMGLVYAIYPGIAPGMIVPFYLVDKIEMVLLIATIFPPVIIALLRNYESTKHLSPQYYKFPDGFQKWSQYTAGRFYLFLNILIPLKISLATIFIYSLHYRDSTISRSIINQPKMSTFLSIVFQMYNGNH